MHLAIFFYAIFMAASLTTAMPATQRAVNSTTTVITSKIASVKKGLICGNVYTGYNTPKWEYHELSGTKDCRELRMSIFLYSIEARCHCRFYT